MKRLATLVLLAVFVLGAGAQTIGLGLDEPALEAAIREMNGIPQEQLAAYYADLALRYRFKAKDIERLALRYRLEAGEVCLVAFMARTRSMTMERVAKMKTPDQTWGEVAVRLRLNQGSPEFGKLKEDAEGDLLRVRDRERIRLETQTQLQTQTQTQLQTQLKTQDGEGAGSGSDSGSGTGKGK